MCRNSNRLEKGIRLREQLKAKKTSRCVPRIIMAQTCVILAVFLTDVIIMQVGLSSKRETSSLQTHLQGMQCVSNLVAHRRYSQIDSTLNTSLLSSLQSSCLSQLRNTVHETYSQ